MTSSSEPDYKADGVSMDVSQEVFGGMTTTRMLLQYFYFQTPQYVYYIIPMSALVATLVTIGLMTKNSELVVMKACGVSLYRAAAPLVVFAMFQYAPLYTAIRRCSSAVS